MVGKNCKHCITKDDCISDGVCLLHEWLQDLDDGIEDNISEVSDFPDLVEEEEAVVNSRVTMKKTLIFQPIKQSELLWGIFIGFRDDKRLLKKIHIAAPARADQLAVHTYMNITSYGTDGLEFFKVVHCTEDSDEIYFEDIGFLVIRDNPNCLVSFGLNINYRTKIIKKKWLEMIGQMFTPLYGIPYVVTLHSKNKRAINFFKRNGFISQINADKTTSLWQLSSPQQ